MSDFVCFLSTICRNLSAARPYYPDICKITTHRKRCAEIFSAGHGATSRVKAHEAFACRKTGSADPHNTNLYHRNVIHHLLPPFIFFFYARFHSRELPGVKTLEKDLSAPDTGFCTPDIFPHIVPPFPHPVLPCPSHEPSASPPRKHFRTPRCRQPPE